MAEKNRRTPQFVTIIVGTIDAKKTQREEEEDEEEEEEEENGGKESVTAFCFEICNQPKP